MTSVSTHQQLFLCFNCGETWKTCLYGARVLTCLRTLLHKWLPMTFSSTIVKNGYVRDPKPETRDSVEIPLSCDKLTDNLRRSWCTPKGTYGGGWAILNGILISNALASFRCGRTSRWTDTGILSSLGSSNLDIDIIDLIIDNVLLWLWSHQFNCKHHHK